MTLDELSAQLSLPSPLQTLDLPVCQRAAVQLSIKRDDLIHPIISGNKWRKLAPNLRALLETARESGPKRIISFGGAYSNHLHATAFVCQQLGVEFVAVIRGERAVELSPTLQDIQNWGAILHFVSREQYRQKNEAEMLAGLQDRYGQACVIPEGGANALAQAGCASIVDEIRQEIPAAFHLALAAGTTTTAAGVGQAMTAGHLWVYSVLKGVSQLQISLQNQLVSEGNVAMHWRGDYHFGGYARINPELVYFIAQFRLHTGIALDPVYTAKLAYGLLRDLELENYPKNQHIVLLHSGGLQGGRGYDFSQYGPSKLSARQKSAIDGWFC